MAVASPFPTLAVVINTKNAAATLRSTLESVKTVADELIVMDMKSDDDTVLIAKRYGAQIFYHRDVGYVEPARNAAIKKAKSDWILVLDADEEIPPSLARFIRQHCLEQEKTDAYFLPRKNIIFGKWVKSGWWPDYVLRLFRRGSVEWSDVIHSVPQVRGTVERVAAQEKLAIVHHNYQTVDQFIDRAQRYAQISATHKKAAIAPDTAFTDELLRRYYQWGGTDDGQHGLMLSFLQASAEIITAAKQWELAGFPARQKNHNLARILQKAARDSWYWEWHRRYLASKGPVRIWYWLRRKINRWLRLA